jgi:hypothetical protein
MFPDALGFRVSNPSRPRIATHMILHYLWPKQLSRPCGGCHTRSGGEAELDHLFGTHGPQHQSPRQSRETLRWEPYPQLPGPSSKDIAGPNSTQFSFSWGRSGGTRISAGVGAGYGPTLLRQWCPSEKRLPAKWSPIGGDHHTAMIYASCVSPGAIR